MTKKEIASLFIKLTGVYLFVSFFAFLQFLPYSIANIRFYDLPSIIGPALQIMHMLIYWAVLFLLIVKSDALAAKLVKDDKPFGLSLSVDRDEIMIIAFCCIGLTLFITTISDLISFILWSISYVRDSNMFPSDVQNSYWSTGRVAKLINIIVRSVAGVYLFCYPSKIINLWKKVRKNNDTEVTYQLGAAKPIDKLSLDDIKEYSIWVQMPDKAGNDGTLVKPVINSQNVTDNLTDTIVAFRIEGSQLCGSADYDNQNQCLVNLTIWIDGKWVLIQDTSDLIPPLTLTAVPKINGQLNVKFRYESFDKSEAHLIGEENEKRSHGRNT